MNKYSICYFSKAFKIVSAALVVLIIQQGSFCQAAEDTKFLKDISTKYIKAKNIEFKYTIDINIPQQKSSIEKGIYYQQGKTFALISDQRQVFSNPKGIWLYNPSTKTVQINDKDYIESGLDGYYSPKSVLEDYTKKAYQATVKELTKDEKRIVFDAVNKTKQAKKIIINVKNGVITDLKIYEKSGANFVLKLYDTKFNKKYPPQKFVFNSNNYPNAHVEDLRLD